MTTNHPSLSTPELVRRLEDPDHTLIDVRPLAAYNGWALAGEDRGGHIPGARSIPLGWTRYMDWVEVVDQKGLEPARSVTLYGYTAGETAEMAGQLERLGFDNLAVYDGFLAEWVADPARPLESLARHRQLVHPAWLHELVHDPSGHELAGRDWVLCHAHFKNLPDYEKGHIPGAVPLDTNTLESPETWNRRSPRELEEALLRLGIRHDTTVVLYGRYSFPTYEQPDPGQSAGHLAAMRCALIMLYAGVEDVRILDGGIHSWTDAGYDLSTDPVRPDPAAEFGTTIPARPELIVDLPGARELLEAEDGDLVSVRSWAEYVGESSGYHYIEKKGRIPGAVFGNGGSDAYHMENHRNLDYTMREFADVARHWAEAGVVPEKRIAFYCGTGWRASEAFMNAYLMGWPRVAIYDGGWYEWSADPDNPIGTGAPE